MATKKKPAHGWTLVNPMKGYVSEIIANRHVDSPVVYYTDDLDDAKAYVVHQAAEARALQLGLIVVEFVTDERGYRSIPEVVE